MRKFIDEFKKFALKGNMIDLAIGVIIASSFNAIVTSIVNDVLMPIFGIILGGKDFSGLCIKVKDATINYGMLIQNIINFIIIAFCLFIVVKMINRFKELWEKKEEEEAKEEAPARSEDIVLLEQIRDSLNELKNKQ